MSTTTPPPVTALESWPEHVARLRVDVSAGATTLHDARVALQVAHGCSLAAAQVALHDASPSPSPSVAEVDADPVGDWLAGTPALDVPVAFAPPPPTSRTALRKPSVERREPALRRTYRTRSYQ